MSQINVTHVYDAAGGNTATFHGVLDTPLGSFRNKIRNGRMDLAVHGTTFTSPTSGSYTLDGWMWESNGGQVVTLSQQPWTMVGSEMQNCLQVQVTTANAAIAAGNFAMVTQPIEGYLVRDLQGNSIAIRFEVKSPKAGTHCVAIRNSGADRAYVLTYNVASANTAQIVTLPLPGGLITAGTWNWQNGVGARISFVLACGTTFQTAAGTWQTGGFIGTAAQVNCMDTVGNIFQITGVQLERGSVSSLFEHRDIGSENTLNQRYARLNRKCVATCTTTTNIAYTEAFDTPMRANPTVGILTTTPYAEAPIFTTAHNGVASTIASSHITTTGVDVQVSGFSSLTVGAMAMFDAFQVLYSAEL